MHARATVCTLYHFIYIYMYFCYIYAISSADLKNIKLMKIYRNYLKNLLIIYLNRKLYIIIIIICHVCSCI